jgi:biotin carboxyl carrier protein
MTMLREISVDGGGPSEVQLTRHHSDASLRIGAKTMRAWLTSSGDVETVSIDGLSTSVTYVVDRDMVLLHAFGRTWRVAIIDPAERALLAGNQSDVAKAPMPGVTIDVLVAVGDAVTAGQALLIIESMKMQMEIKSSRAGTIEQVNARTGESFALGAPLVTLVSLEEAEA